MWYCRTLSLINILQNRLIFNFIIIDTWNTVLHTYMQKKAWVCLEPFQKTLEEILSQILNQNSFGSYLQNPSQQLKWKLSTSTPLLTQCSSKILIGWVMAGKYWRSLLPVIRQLCPYKSKDICVYSENTAIGNRIISPGSTWRCMAPSACANVCRVFRTQAAGSRHGAAQATAARSTWLSLRPWFGICAWLSCVQKPFTAAKFLLMSPFS